MDTLTGRFGPREIALAVAVGLMLGLVPKANLLFVILALIFFLSHANVVLGIVITIGVSLLTPWIDPTHHRIGGEILMNPQVQQWEVGFYRVPLVPWLMLDNTVVMGAFLVGLVLFFPVFLLLWIPLKIVWPKKRPEEDLTATEKG